MATAIEYGLIAATISIGIVVAVNGVGPTNRWDDNAEKKAASQLCAARPAGDTKNVVVTAAISHSKWEFKCSDWPRISYPTFVRTVY